MDKKEFEFRRELIEMEHKFKMDFVEFIRETERLKHEWEKERQRIKSAEIRKVEERKQNREFTNNYWKKDHEKGSHYKS